MIPYYEDEFVTLYHGDCREVLPSIAPESVDLLCTDPPYGVAYKIEARMTGYGNRRVLRGGKPAIYGDDKPFNPSHLLKFKRCVLFGANHYSDQLPVSGGWLVWDKTGGGRGPDDTFADCELAWTNLAKTPSIFHYLWKGLVRDGEAGMKVLHPTQKPVALMDWIVRTWTKPNDVVLDPYMGSGPIPVACKQLARRCISVEIEEAYCEIAANRLAQGVLFGEFG